jgi:hypothetical protein
MYRLREILSTVSVSLMADISKVFEVADILWVRIEISGLRAEKKAALHSSDHRFIGLPDTLEYLVF